jgi:hypothetical protein
MQRLSGEKRRLMKRLIVPLIALIALAGVVTTTRAGAIAISGTFEGDATLTPTGMPGIYTQSFSGDGDDTTFGAFTTTSQSTIDFSKPPNIAVSNGMFTETFARGALFGTSSGAGTGNGSGTATFTIDVVITGGNGIFAGYTGTATLMGTITQTSPTTESISNGSYSGSLNTPEPATMVLYAVGATVLLGYGLWRRGRR